MVKTLTDAELQVLAQALGEYATQPAILGSAPLHFKRIYDDLIGFATTPTPTQANGDPIPDIPCSPEDTGTAEIVEVFHTLLHTLKPLVQHEAMHRFKQAARDLMPNFKTALLAHAGAIYDELDEPAREALLVQLIARAKDQGMQPLQQTRLDLDALSAEGFIRTHARYKLVQELCAPIQAIFYRVNLALNQAAQTFTLASFQRAEEVQATQAALFEDMLEETGIWRFLPKAPPASVMLNPTEACPV
jgi:hypothetical protein